MSATEELGRRELLLFQRDRLLEALRSSRTESQSLAGISKELRAVTVELEKLPPPEVVKESPVAQITAARARRSAASSDRPSAGRRGQPRRRGSGNRAG